MAYPKRYLAPINGPTEFLDKYKKWYLLPTLPTAVVLCYLIAEKCIMTLLFGEQLLTTFPYSFIFSLLIYGTLLWLSLMVLIEKLHWQLKGTRPSL